MIAKWYIINDLTALEAFANFFRNMRSFQGELLTDSNEIFHEPIKGEKKKQKFTVGKLHSNSSHLCNLLPIFA